ncbi:MAG: YitT family protein [Clostridia bacterium]|nr:YitT family protein [Clostridia bacterium]
MRLITKIQNKYPWLSYVIISLMATADALFSIAFVYPNNFAPAGIHGLTTMVQHMLGISTGYTFLIVNVPMLIIAFFVLNRGYSVKNLCYVGFFSVMTLVFQKLIAHFDLSWLEYRAASPETSIILAIGVGLFTGLAYTLTVSLGGSTGGTDILAALINHYRPSFNTVWVLFTINISVSITSFFVYGREYLPVVISVLCSFVSGTVSDHLLKGASSALKFEIITTQPEMLASDIMRALGHGCTQLPAKGMYSQRDCAMLVCVINTRQRTELEKIISKYTSSFGYCTPIRSVYGYFDK